MIRKLFAELIGTFCLIFFGCGAIMVNSIYAEPITHLGISAVFGLVVMAVIYAVGDVSGAHLNPAVTIGFLASGRLPKILALPYIASQFAGAMLASIVLKGLLPTSKTLGETIPSGTWAQSFGFEIILTFVLMFVILNVSEGAKEKGIMAGIAIGGTVALDAIVGGPVCGASMNPARSFGPALISGNLAFIWVYILAPIIGAYFAVLGCKVIQKPGCCKLDQSLL